MVQTPFEARLFYQKISKIQILERRFLRLEVVPMPLSLTEPAVTPSEADAYATLRGWGDWIGADSVKAAAIRRSQDYIAGEYNKRWVDEWPNDEAPDGVKFAIIEGARRELVKPGSLAPDLKRGGLIDEVGAGSARVKFAQNAPADTTFTTINNKLNGLVRSVARGVTFGRAVRG